MEIGDIDLGIYLTVLYSGLATLLWGRLNRIQDKLEGKADKDDINRQLAALSSYVAGLRSDLTQVALAVGAQRPRAVE